MSLTGGPRALRRPSQKAESFDFLRTSTILVKRARLLLERWLSLLDCKVC